MNIKTAIKINLFIFCILLIGIFGPQGSTISELLDLFQEFPQKIFACHNNNGSQHCPAGRSVCYQNQCSECRNNSDCNSNYCNAGNCQQVYNTPYSSPYSTPYGSPYGTPYANPGNYQSPPDTGNNCQGQGDHRHPYCVRANGGNWLWGCRQNTDCPNDFPVCSNTICTEANGSQGVTGGTGGRTCIENRDCTGANNPYCLNGHCQECTGDARCGSGKVCSVNGNCINAPVYGSPYSTPTGYPTPYVSPYVTPSTGYVTPYQTPPTQSYSVSGRVFIDTDTDQTKDADEQWYTGTVDVRLSPAFGIYSTTTSGTYSFQQVPAGLYSLRLFTLPSGYSCTYPPTNCTLTNLAVGGNIANLNIGIVQTNPWLQAMDLDIRNDQEGFKNAIPSATTCPKVAVVNGTGGSAGIVFSGNNTNDFGTGNASNANWQVSGPGTAYANGNTKTSYASIQANLAANKKTPLTMSSYCTNTANCTITNTIQSQPYLHQTTDLVLTNVTITTQKTVILAEKNVIINGPIQVTPGAFFMIVAKGNIIVSNTVGAAPNVYSCATTATQQLQGFFSTDSSFIITSAAACPTADRQLNMAGSVITNAGQTGGKFTNQRTLCGANLQYPAFTISPRLDFALNAPPYLLRTSTNWQEVAP